MTGRTLTMRQVARRSTWLAMFVATTVLACEDTEMVQRGERPECPHDWPPLISLDGGKEGASGQPVTTVVRRSTFTVTRDIPEFNDCQRILLPDDPVSQPEHYGRPATRYGPLMAVFMSDTLADSQHVDSVRAVAQVFNYSSDFSYPPLGIGPLYNCLYMLGDPSFPRAYMLHRDTNSTCAKLPPARIVSGGTELAVVPALPGRFVAADYPRAARWEWDEVNSIQYIGLTCGGNRWCQVGRAQSGQIERFHPADPYIPPPGTPTAEDRVRYISGWHDRQQLAMKTDAGLVPSGVVGWVFPSPELGSREWTAYRDQFRVVGHIALEAVSENAPGVSYYKKKLNYDVVPRGSPFGDMTELSLCLGTVHSCGVPRNARSALVAACAATAQENTHLTGPSYGGVTQASADPLDPKARWFARVRSPGRGGAVRYRCVTRRVDPHVASVGIPATTRWRWLPDDETTWDFCGSGCCEMSAK
jgi:hypothetical protein